MQVKAHRHTHAVPIVGTLYLNMFTLLVYLCSKHTVDQCGKWFLVLLCSFIVTNFLSLQYLYYCTFCKKPLGFDVIADHKTFIDGHRRKMYKIMICYEHECNLVVMQQNVIVYM